MLDDSKKNYEMQRDHVKIKIKYKRTVNFPQDSPAPVGPPAGAKKIYATKH